MWKTVVLIDGGYLRAVSRQFGFDYNPEWIQKVAHKCISADQEVLLKILYYDCPPYKGKIRFPVSKKQEEREPDSRWLEDLSRRDYFAVRLGTLKFRGFSLKQVPPPNRSLEDADFKENYEQKGVDMRIGLDIASMCERKIAERLVLLSGDTDMVPAMKHARKAGVQVVLAELPGRNLPDALLAHADLRRKINWPSTAQSSGEEGGLG